MKAYLETGPGNPEMLGIVVESETTEEASRLLDNLWLGPEYDSYPADLSSYAVQKRGRTRVVSFERVADGQIQLVIAPGVSR